jgi:hypothetical protein
MHRNRERQRAAPAAAGTSTNAPIRKRDRCQDDEQINIEIVKSRVAASFKCASIEAKFLSETARSVIAVDSRASSLKHLDCVFDGHLAHRCPRKSESKSSSKRSERGTVSPLM